jgi:uncharacterized protein YjbI with pentapeptide repeats
MSGARATLPAEAEAPRARLWWRWAVRRLRRCSLCMGLVWVFAALAVSALLGFAYLAYSHRLAMEAAGTNVFSAPFWVDGTNARHIQSLVLTAAGLIGAPVLLWRTCIADKAVRQARQQNKINRRGLEESRKNIERTLAENARLEQDRLQQTATLEQKRLIASRYEGAVPLLGSEDTSVKLGAIYALGDVARESETLCMAVAETFAAWLRRHCAKGATPVHAVDHRSLANAIVTMLNLMFLRDAPPEKRGLNLLDTDLSWARFEGRPLRGAQLRDADLHGAMLEGIDLCHADLTGANLRETILTRARLSGAILANAECENLEIQNTKAIRCRADGAKCKDAQFVNVRWIRFAAPGIDLTCACLRGSRFFRADLSDAHFDRTVLHGTRFRGSAMQRAIFRETNCEGADFSRCDLSDADFSACGSLNGTDFAGAVLDRANIEGVDLKKALHLMREQLERARGNRATGLPEGYEDGMPDTWLE